MELGYFDTPDATVPAFDPGLDVHCPVCAVPLSEPLKTISLCAAGSDKSYFFRTHKTCWDTASPEMKADIEALIIDGLN